LNFLLFVAGNSICTRALDLTQFSTLRDDHGIERPEEKGRWRLFGHATE
jgi:hypothetical protein